MVVRSSLTAKLLLLLALPLLSQLFVVVTLAQLEARVESEARKSEHVRRLVTAVKEFEQFAYRYAIEHGGERSLSADSLDPRAIQDIRTDAFKLVKKIEEVSDYDEATTKSVSELRRLMNRSFEIYDQLRENWLQYRGQRDNGLMARRSLWTQLRFVLLEIHERVRTVGTDQISIEAASIEQETSYQRNLGTCY